MAAKYGASEPPCGAEYTRQRDLGKEAELSAQEIVRRAERRIGQLIREGQAAGEIEPA